MLISARIRTPQCSRTSDLQIRNLLDDPSLRTSLGLTPASNTNESARPANIRRLLELAAA